jgi:two-component system chemotaxis sensor kinase CheA
LVSALAPLIANFIYVAVSFFFKTALAGINFTAFVMIISNFIFYYNVVRNDLFDLAPKAYAITLDLIRDAFVVLDLDMSYTGSNKKAAELFPALSEFQKGASILGLKDWPLELFSEEGEAMGIVPSRTVDSAWHTASAKNETEFTLPKRPGKIYSGWMNEVASESGAAMGWVIMIQDITETVSLIRNIQAQRDEIAAMRDNLNEGIFLMNRELIIQDSYSRAMEDILSARNFHGRRFTDLLSGSFSSRDLGLVADYFSMIINKSVDPDLLEDINPLGEFLYTSAETGELKTLRCLFAPVDQGNGEIFVMGTIQDITAETLLKKQLADEEARRHDEMRSLFEVMQVDQSVFKNFIEDSDYEFNRAREYLLDNEIPNRQKLVDLYQSVHAIKSNAVIVGLSGFGEKLHALEEKIKALRGGDAEPDSGDIAAITDELEKRVQDKDKLIEIFRRLSDFSASAAGVTMKDDEVFMAVLRRACERVAADENKKALIVVEAFDKETLNKGPRRVMKEILIQLVRNSVHHGIETPEERRVLGKDETGKISLSITIEDGAVRMVLGDDGKGLDYGRIAQEAKAKGLLGDIPESEIDKGFLSDLIFSPGFSTSATENIHAGRGVGLSLVKDRLNEVNGKIDIQNKEGQGLVFEIEIPIN